MLGTCRYCARPLYTAQSAALGYGPDCAERYGLPVPDHDGNGAPAPPLDPARAPALAAALTRGR